jgi:hypothetical protein
MRMIIRRRTASVGAIAALLWLCGCGQEGAEKDAGSASEAVGEETVQEDGGGEAPEPAAADEVIAALVKINACTKSDVFKSRLDVFGSLASLPGVGNAELLLAFIGCSKEAATCEEVLACQRIDSTASCDPATFGGYCQGNTAVLCQPMADETAYVAKIDCAEYSSTNGTCMVSPKGTAMCGNRTCSGADGTSCDGNMLVECEDGIGFGFDCADFDMKCMHATDEGAEQAICSTGETCNSDSCDGDTLKGCKSGLVTFAKDCKWFGPDFACVVSGGTVGGEQDAECALPLAQQACQDDDPSFCEGDVANVCIGGKWFKFDCGAFLGAKCESQDQVPDWPLNIYGDGVRCSIK